jgi:hypothetical protein
VFVPDFRPKKLLKISCSLPIAGIICSWYGASDSQAKLPVAQ